MALRLMYDGRQRLAAGAPAAMEDTNIAMRLFQGDITPTEDDDLATYTAAEADYTGYAQQNVAGWGAAVDAPPRSVVTADPLTFTVGATPSVGNQIYGYFCTNGSGALLFAERFDAAPIDMTVAGNSIIITPAFSIRSEYA